MSDTSDNKTNGADKGADAPERDLGPDEYEPTAAERAAIDGHFSRKRSKPPAPKIRLKEVAAHDYDIKYAHASQSLGEILLENALCVADSDFLHGILQQVLNASQVDGKVSEHMMNFALAAIRGVRPKDEVEVMLATQMAAVHLHAMSFSMRVACTPSVEGLMKFEPALNRLTRTFAAQMEALKRYRSKGEQVVRVERVYVGPGAQAIVGNVAQGAGGPHPRNEEPTHDANQGRTAIPPPDGTALPIDLTANKAPMPAARGEGQAPLQVSRRSRDRRAKG